MEIERLPSKVSPNFHSHRFKDSVSFLLQSQSSTSSVVETLYKLIIMEHKNICKFVAIQRGSKDARLSFEDVHCDAAKKITEDLPFVTKTRGSHYSSATSDTLPPFEEMKDSPAPFVGRKSRQENIKTGAERKETAYESPNGVLRSCWELERTMWKNQQGIPRRNLIWKMR